MSTEPITKSKLRESTNLMLSRLNNKTKPEEKQLSNLEASDYESQLKKAQLDSTKQDIKERKKFASWIFFMVAVWLLIILTVLILCGLSVLSISDSVQLGLIGATTINVTAFFLVVTKYLFPSSNNK